MELRKSFGQHLLISKGVLKKIASELRAEGRHVVEIGGGTGNLTREILSTNPAKLTVLEVDPGMVERLKGIGDPRLEVIHADATTFELCSLGSRLLLCGNLPYNVWSGIIERVVFSQRCVEKGVFMLQKETALKLTGKERPGWLGIFFRTYFYAEYLMSVPARFFVPRPKVSSGVIRFYNKHAEGVPQDLSSYKKFLTHLFSSPRKMLRSKLPMEILREAGIEETKRSQELSLEEVLRLYNVYGEKR